MVFKAMGLDRVPDKKGPAAGRPGTPASEGQMQRKSHTGDWGEVAVRRMQTRKHGGEPTAVAVREEGQEWRNRVSKRPSATEFQQIQLRADG